jgi:iron complex outermembrane receptor protein
MDLAGRYEHYSDFGSATVGKATVRYDFSPAIAIRGTVSNGFRAPTLAEEYYSGVNVGPSSAEGQIPPNSAAAASAGFQPLKPELSQNYSAGFVFHPISNLQITLDAYQINLHNRILVTGDFIGSEGGVIYSQGVLNTLAERGLTLQSDVTYRAIATFANAVSTRTDGIELAANYASDFGDYGHVDWYLGFNYNKTQITKVTPLPANLEDPAIGQTSYLNPLTASTLTTGNPREKVILQGLWTKDRFSVTLRETIYGPTFEYNYGPTPGQYVPNSIGTTGITDLDIGFKVTQFMKLDVGANNLFNTKPPVNVQPPGAGYATYVYKVPYLFAPWNPNGGYYYGRVTVNF